MRKAYRTIVILVFISVTVMACNFPLSGKQDEESAIQTAIAQTMTADQQALPTLQPTLTLAPTHTVSVPPTNTPSPCNDAYFLSETVPDGSEFEPGESFTKTWRLQNRGTCTWNTNYKLAFASGDPMGGPSSQNLTQMVAPGEQVDISVKLKAPASTGTYKGNWRIVDENNNPFVYNIWVEIKVVEAAVTEPDLTITEFSLNPATPTQGEKVHVRVRANNTGTADSGGFKMDWYGLSTFSSPSCSWNIVGGLAAGGSVLMECDYSFSSGYPADNTTIVYIDTNDDVEESNEDNNSASISPFGVAEP